jgi:hypothetical protein
MRLALVAALLIAVAVPAMAGGNEGAWGYISFDPVTPVHEIDPAPYTQVNAYICFSNLTMGFTSASFMVTDVATVYPGLFAPPSFVNTISEVAVGNVFTGITVAATECQPPPFVCVGYVSLFYLGGGPACIELLDHPDYPRWVTDCTLPDALVDTFCIHGHGSIGGAVCPDIECDSPVEAETWGSIKSLYR